MREQVVAMDTGHIYLGLLLHNHQPVGNFPSVIQQVYEQSYLPMLEALERHPGVRVSLHYTGSLLDWLEATHPEFLERIAALIQRGQVEIVGGGYYEPILPAIPDRDKIGQIRAFSERLHALFGTTPDGMWLAERVWEPSLPRYLEEAGIQWTILDDTHLKATGLDDDDLYGYYATEDQSGVLKVYATSKKLRYTVPWRPVAETIQWLRSLAKPGQQRIAVMGDDGEKFGSWPETGPYCWGEDGWVDAFLSALEQERDWLHTIPLGEYARSAPALGRIYIPTTSYIEMSEWSLPPRKAYQFGRLLHKLEENRENEILQFFRGGFWRNFLARYPEVNNQHKKMLRVHERVHAVGETEALRHLWKAQANDTYWHGLFGGAYMGHVRSAIYHHLIRAEHLADRVLHQNQPWQSYEFTDFDRDTHNELIIEGSAQNLYLAPERGGTLFEWDLRQSAHNILSVMARHPESYHQVLREHEQERRQKARQAATEPQALEPESPHTTVRTKEPDLDRLLVIDRHRRTSLKDHFLPAGLPFPSFLQNRYEELGDFIEQPYHTEVEQDEQGLLVTLTRQGKVKRAGALGPLPVLLTKQLVIAREAERLSISYTLENRGRARLQTCFACEWNLHLLAGGKNEQAYCLIEGQAPALLDQNEEVADVQALHVGNTWLKQDIGFLISQKALLWRFSLDAVTGSEAGFERTHQGTCIVFLWPVVLDSGGVWRVRLDCTGSQPEGFRLS
uniref:Alpha-amylase n=1 Tax=Thermosporothrix sp. COM3 TaxID=2490863 RepID=A0A455SL21_9CHLR|nr:alpha-amylase [Thermosporothrix sp. COM3]